MRSCELAEDYGSFEKVCQHITSHHRNDLDVLRDCYFHVLDLLRPALPITEDTWTALIDMAGLVSAKASHPYAPAKILLQYALFQVHRGQDPIPTLQRYYKIENVFRIRFHSELLKPALLTIMRQEVVNGSENPWHLLTDLLNAGVPDLFDLVSNAFSKSESSNLGLYYTEDLLPALRKYPEYNQLLESIFPLLQPDEMVIDWYWRNFPAVVVNNYKIAVEYLVNEEYIRRCKFYNDRKLLAFFGLLDKIDEMVLENWGKGSYVTRKNIFKFLKLSRKGVDALECLQKLPLGLPKEEQLKSFALKYVDLELNEAQELLYKKSFETVIMTEKMVSASMRSHMADVYKACEMLVKETELRELGLHIMSAVAPLSDAAKFLAVHESYLSTVFERKRALKILWRLFLEVPCSESWSALEKMSTSCDYKSVRRVLRVCLTPELYVGRLVNLIWGRLEGDEEKLKFMKSINVKNCSLLTAGTMLELLKLKDAGFSYHCWLVDPKCQSVMDILAVNLVKDAFAKEFTDALAMGAIEIGSRGADILKTMLDSSLLKDIRPELLYRLQLLQLQLYAPESFPTAVVSFLSELSNSELLWPLIAEALHVVIQDVKLSDLALLVELIRLFDSRVGLVLCAYMLPNSVPLPEPYAVDPLIQAYEEIVQTLKCAKDPAAMVHLHNHLNKRSPSG